MSNICMFAARVTFWYDVETYFKPDNGYYSNKAWQPTPLSNQAEEISLPFRTFGKMVYVIACHQLNSDA